MPREIAMQRMAVTTSKTAKHAAATCTLKASTIVDWYCFYKAIHNLAC